MQVRDTTGNLEASRSPSADLVRLLHRDIAGYRQMPSRVPRSNNFDYEERTASEFGVGKIARERSTVRTGADIAIILAAVLCAAMQ